MPSNNTESVLNLNFTNSSLVSEKHDPLFEHYQNLTILEIGTTLSVISAQYLLDNIGYFFYAVNPRELMNSDVNLVPRLVEKTLPLFGLFALVETIIILIKCRQMPRSNDVIASMSQGIFQESFR